MTTPTDPPANFGYRTRAQGMREHTEHVLARLREEPDAVLRAREATSILALLEESVAPYRDLRLQALNELREQGLSYEAIGAAIGLSGERVRQILST